MNKSRTYRVLIVDDNQPFIKAFKFQLQDILGERIELIDEANDGEGAISQILLNRYDVVFMDINMPGLDGIEATRKVDGLQRDMKVIALSFHKEMDYVQRMIEAGARHYIQKENLDEKTLLSIFP